MQSSRHRQSVFQSPRSPSLGPAAAPGASAGRGVEADASPRRVVSAAVAAAEAVDLGSLDITLSRTHGDLTQAMKAVVGRLEGAFTLLAVHSDAPDKRRGRAFGPDR